MNTVDGDKITIDDSVFSNELITEREGYDAVLYMLNSYWEETGSDDLTELLSKSGYGSDAFKTKDSDLWRNWLEAIDKVKKDGPPLF